ncbi:hypothetical protein QWJ90_09395 [Microbacterium oryzae]|uniref:hypothetical protein n=1 Tax=Microbacterium oryzae TaxID=743009 RepID=UPI0025AF2824|nr:hypothetical protein [Microbacterium oryzae]MDN3311143.1 hypothetical protein [Microbacterium oryzae]
MTEESSLDADGLLAGPRGRRLCLELATECDEAVSRAVCELAYGLDPASGSSRVRFTFAADDGGEPHSPATLEALEGLLAGVDVSAITPAAVHRAFGLSVDFARYWQEPDGEDILAALPVVVAALRPLAEQVVRMAPPWWSEPRRDVQWAIEWHDPGDRVTLDGDSARMLAEWGEVTACDEARARIDRPVDPVASYSGTWWVAPSSALMTTGTTSDGEPVGLRLVEDSLGWEEAAAIPVRGVGRTFEIRGAEDWAELCRRFPLEVTASRRHDWYRVTGRDGRWLIPDWRRVAGEWDAVHLTVAAYLRAATRAIRVDDESATMIAGWGPDATLWLADVVRGGDGGRVGWCRDHSSATWRRG